MLKCPCNTCFKSKKDSGNDGYFVVILKNFDDFHLRLGEILYIAIYGFLNKIPFRDLQAKTGLSLPTIFKLIGRVRNVLHTAYKNGPIFGENGQIVEMDESKFVKKIKKVGYQGRALSQQGWVIGIRERGSNKTKAVVVDNRDSNTILSIAKKYISTKCSAIMTDC